MSTIFMVVTAAVLPLGADFVRGDSNSDGRVSIADVYADLVYLFRGSPEPTCMSAGDFNDSGDIDIVDAAYAMVYLLQGGAPPPDPFPALGMDATPDSLGCASYGHGSPLEDSAARLEVLAATAPEGEGVVTLTIAVSSSVALAGYSGAIRLPPGVAAGAEKTVRDLTRSPNSGMMGASLRADVLHFALVTSMIDGNAIPPASSTEVLELTLCLQDGLAPGVYPLELEAGELIDDATARAITPSLAGSTLTVPAVVTGQAECNPPPPEPIPVNAAFKLQDAIAPPGGDVSVPFIMRADAPIQGYTFAIDFDETLVECTDIEKVWQKPAGTDPEYTFGKTWFDNRDELPGSSGLAEGYLLGAIIFDVEEPVFMPADTDNLALRFHMKVKEGAADGSTELRFLEHIPPTGQQMRNIIWALGENATPDTAESFLLVDCLLQILPDGAVFVRGDSNRDDRVDVSDAVNTLGHLFLGAGPLFCTDAADANDDGTLDISDAIATLEYLFSGTVPALPEPHGSPGSDPTADSLYCYSRP